MPVGAGRWFGGTSLWPAGAISVGGARPGRGGHVRRFRRESRGEHDGHEQHGREQERGASGIAMGTRFLLTRE